MFFLDRLATPIGTALVVTDDDGLLRAFDWSEHEDRMRALLRRHYGPAATSTDRPAPGTLRDALDAYFAGDVGRIDAIACRTAGTPFQRRVWTALRDIPVGRTVSYGALATRLGVPDAVRAVGAANGANPIGVVLPCHRVVGANGALTGYGGGLERKRWLLAHEGATLLP